MGLSCIFCIGWCFLFSLFLIFVLEKIFGMSQFLIYVYILVSIVMHCIGKWKLSKPQKFLSLIFSLMFFDVKHVLFFLKASHANSFLLFMSSSSPNRLPRYLQFFQSWFDDLFIEYNVFFCFFLGLQVDFCQLEHLVLCFLYILLHFC